MTILSQDLRYAARLLIKNPGFSLAALLALGLGIGANTAIFSVVDAVVLRPLPYARPERLVMVWATQGAKGKDTVVPADFLDWQRESRAFERLAGFSRLSLNLMGRDRPERVRAFSVTANFFSTLGVAPLLGRAFLEPAAHAAARVSAADSGGEGLEAILSYPLWRRSFGGDPAVVGRSVRLDDRPHTIVGVMPAGFGFHDEAEIWARAARGVPQLAIDAGADVATRRGLSFMRAFGRLRPGVPLGQARAELAAIALRQEKDFPKTNSRRGVLLVGMRDEIAGDVRSALWVLLGAVAFVQVIACTNIANLLLARATVRRREVALRMTQGATRGRLARQLLTESLLLAALAGACGLLLALWGTRLLLRLAPGDIPRLDEVHADGRVLLFTAGLSLLTGVVLGLLPVLRTGRFEIVPALKEGSRSSESRGGRRVRGLLVVAEVAAAVVLLAGAGVMLRSFSRLNLAEPGFDPAHLVTFEVSLPAAHYGQESQQRAFFSALLEKLQALPGVSAAGAVLDSPAGGDDINIAFAIAGRPKAAAPAEYRDGFQVVSADYFRTLRIPVLAGRTFTTSDREGAPRVAVLSEAMARRYWRHSDPVGSRITFDDPGAADARWYTVVGVVGNVRHQGLGAAPRAEAYLPYAQWPWPFMALVVRAAGEPLALVPAFRRQVASIDPAQPITAVRAMDDLLASSIARPRFTSLLLSLFALVALILASIGIYGVMAYTVAQRTQEIGVRMALGAARGAVLRQVVGRGMAQALLGAACGLGGALALTRALRSLVFEVSVTDRVAFIAAPAILLLCAFLANLLPARRAAEVDPAIAIKQE
jgi:predicted permease